MQDQQGFIDQVIKDKDYVFIAYRSTHHERIFAHFKSFAGGLLHRCTIQENAPVTFDTDTDDGRLCAVNVRLISSAEPNNNQVEAEIVNWNTTWGFARADCGCRNIYVHTSHFLTAPEYMHHLDVTSRIVCDLKPSRKVGYLEARNIELIQTEGGLSAEEKQKWQETIRK